MHKYCDVPKRTVICNKNRIDDRSVYNIHRRRPFQRKREICIIYNVCLRAHLANLN